MNVDTKACQNCKAHFTVETDDFAFYEKMGVLAPALCPECRFKRRCLFRNETTLYSRACALCKKAVVSCFNPKSPYTIYCHSCFESDTWDPYSFGIAYDPARPFFDQLAELSRRVPKKALMTSSSTKLGPNVRSDYINYAGGNKDCYLIFNGGGNENLMYSRGVSFSRDSLDGYFGVNAERCYETVNVNESAGVVFGQNVTGSLDSMFLLNASGCQDCFGCVNLRNKSYHFMNEPLSKEEYRTRVKEVMGSYAKVGEARQRFEEFSFKFPRRATSNLKTTSSSGDYIFESKNVVDSFEASRCEDCRHLFSVKLARDCFDLLGFGYDSERMLETVASGYSSRIIGCFWAENSQDVSYSFQVRSSEHCVGCDGVRGARYAILNKRYSEEEYMRFKERIVAELSERGEYGLYFPPALAFFGYNETVGQDNMPLTKEEALAQGLPWQDELQITKGKETIKPEQIPDHIRDVKDSITNEVLACLACGRNYRITPAELQFYRKMTLPIPRVCFFCRHHDRIRRRGPMKLFDRTCAKCTKAIKTNYAPDRPEIVYCEACYQNEVV